MIKNIHVEIVTCSVCYRPYYRKKKGAKKLPRLQGINASIVRAHNCRTCGPECSRKWTAGRNKYCRDNRTPEQRERAKIKQRVYSKRFNEKKRKEKLYATKF